jgi:hypothetical protein
MGYPEEPYDPPEVGPFSGAPGGDEPSPGALWKGVLYSFPLTGDGEDLKGPATDHFTTNVQRGVTVMKKRNIAVHFIVLLMLIATFAACASTRTHESTGEYIDDSVITTKVKSLLAADDFLKSFQIGVETFQGTVQLSGFVNSQKAVDKAAEIVRSVKGIKSIKNNLIVK